MLQKNTLVTPEQYIAQIPEPRRREIQILHDLIRKAVPEHAPYAESGGIGYGRYHYKYASGREGDAALVGLANRKQYISVYLMGTVDGEYVAEAAKARFPKADVGKSCIRFKRTSDINLDEMREVVKASVAGMNDLLAPRGGTAEVAGAAKPAKPAARAATAKPKPAQKA